MKCKFVVGQKVVCLRELTWRMTHNFEETEVPSLVKAGAVYTVSAIEADNYPCVQRFPGRVLLQLLEVPGRDWFEHTVFKPLEERKTDISVFTRMLKQKEMIDG